MTLIRIFAFIWGLLTFMACGLLASVLLSKIPQGQPVLEAIRGDKGLQLLAIMVVMTLINVVLSAFAIWLPRRK